MMNCFKMHKFKIYTNEIFKITFQIYETIEVGWKDGISDENALKAFNSIQRNFMKCSALKNFTEEFAATGR